MKTAFTYVLSVSSLQHSKGVDCHTVTSAGRPRKAANKRKETMPMTMNTLIDMRRLFSFQI